MSEADKTRSGFGTFEGVFRPIVLTILGAMLYLREGWLVGNNGLLGALLVIAAAYTITGTTALSLSTIATNVRVSQGGSFAIVARALGLEAGGAIGVPLYVAQSISSVMYLYAFSEACAVLAPTHDGRLVAAAGFVLVAGIALVSANLAARAQAVMIGVIAIALTSAVAGLWTAPSLHTPQWVGVFNEVSLLGSFAIFFPAATGIMVGAGMSGELADPRRALPRGTLAAWGTTFALYAAFAVWYAVMAPPDLLRESKTLMVDRAGVGWLVLAGLLSSTLMAALSSLVAAPRLLAAMARYDIVPGSSWLQQTTETGEPRNATLATLGLASLGLLAGSLDAIAPVITSCFLITYLAVNGVVYLEQRVAMISFRPTFAVPAWVSALGMVACVLALGLTSPGGGLFEVIAVLGLYGWLIWRDLDTPWETVQSGLAMSLAASLTRWAGRRRRSERSWKPDLLVPVPEIATLRVVAPWVRRATAVQGSVKYIALSDDRALADALQGEVDALRLHGRYASWHQMPAESAELGIRLTMNAMRGTFFATNLVVLTDALGEPVIQALRDHGRDLAIGTALLLLASDPDRAAPPEIHVWLSDRSPDWEIGLRVVNTDLPVLLAWLLARRRGSRVRLYTAVSDPEQRGQALHFLSSLVDQGRLPSDTGVHASDHAFLDAVREAGPATVHLFGLPETIELDRLGLIRDAASGPCLFLQDSGQESLLA